MSFFPYDRGNTVLWNTGIHPFTWFQPEDSNLHIKIIKYFVAFYCNSINVVLNTGNQMTQLKLQSGTDTVKSLGYLNIYTT
jgi:hypothetical protein